MLNRLQMQIVLNEWLLFLDVINGDDDFDEDDLLMIIIHDGVCICICF